MDALWYANGPLSCPYCGCDYLSLMNVEVCNEADAVDKGVEVTVQGVQVRITPDPSSTPVTWGEGVRLTFWCAWCPVPVVLSLTYYQGQTIQLWNRADTPPDSEEDV